MKPGLFISTCLLVALFAACSPQSDPDALQSAGLGKYPMTMIKGIPPQEGSPLILEFWASWCGPCRAQFQHLNELFPQLDKIGIQMVALTNEPIPFTRAFVETQKMNYPVACDPEGIYMNAVGIEFIPQAIILDSKGRIVWQGHTQELNLTMIRQALANKR